MELVLRVIYYLLRPTRDGPIPLSLLIWRVVAVVLFFAAMVGVAFLCRDCAGSYPGW